MVKVTKEGKTIIDRRDRIIFDLILMMKQIGKTNPYIYEKLSLITGLSISTVTYIHYKELKRINDVDISGINLDDYENTDLEVTS